MLFEVLLDVALLVHKVEALHRVNDMLRIVECVLLEVALVDFVCEVDQPVYLNVVGTQKTVLLENLVVQVRKPMLTQNVFKQKGIKGGQVELVHDVFQVLNLDEFLQLHDFKELMVQLLEL